MNMGWRRAALLGLVMIFMAPAVAAAAAADAKSDAAVQVALVARKGEAAGGPKVIRLKRNDSVVIQVESDAADDVHVHGYDLHAAVAPGTPATLRFIARRTGRFAVEMHRAETQLAILEIYPK